MLGATDDLRKPKSSMLQENNKITQTPHACTKIHRKDGEKEQRCILLRLEVKARVLRASHQLQLLYEWVYIVAGHISISSFALRTQRAE